MADNEVLTDEQKKFLAECEELFKDRYTEKDEEFMKIKNAKPEDPPIVCPWNPRSGRNRWSRPNNQHRNRHYDNYKRQRNDNSSTWNEPDRRRRFTD